MLFKYKTNRLEVHAITKIKFLRLFGQERESAQQQNIIFRRLKHHEKLQAPVIWKSSSQISNFRKCSINCAVVLQCQQVTHAQSSLTHNAINHSVVTSISSQQHQAYWMSNWSITRNCEERKHGDDGNQKVEQGKKMRETKHCWRRGGEEGRQRNTEREEQQQCKGYKEMKKETRRRSVSRQVICTYSVNVLLLPVPPSLSTHYML